MISNAISFDFFSDSCGNFFGWHSTHALLRAQGPAPKIEELFSGAMQRRWRWVQMGFGMALDKIVRTQRIS